MSIEIDIECEECGSALDYSSSMSSYGGVTVKVNLCSSCITDMTNEFENETSNLSETIFALEAHISSLNDEIASMGEDG